MTKLLLDVDSSLVEDCLKKITNRFRLVILASHRARQIFTCSNLKHDSLESRKIKSPVLALLEIARGDVNENSLIESLTLNYKKSKLGFKTEQISDEVEKFTQRTISNLE